jgi:hypothetical protein
MCTELSTVEFAVGSHNVTDGFVVLATQLGVSAKFNVLAAPEVTAVDLLEFA